MRNPQLHAQKCIHCKQSAFRLIIFALLQDLGCSTSVDPINCDARQDGGEHEFLSIVQPERPAA